jgi:MFS family permease
LILGAVDAAGYSVIAPALPGLRTATGASVTEISLLAASFPLTMLAAFGAAGSLVQAGRTQAALLIGLVALLIGALGFAVGVDLRVLFAARALMGIGSGCYGSG